MKLSDPQIERQQVEHVTPLHSSQQLRVAKNVTDVFGQRSQHRLPLLRFSLGIVIRAAGVHQLLKKAGRLRADDSLDTAIGGNICELLRDLDRPIKSAKLIHEPLVFSLAAGPDATLTD